MPSTPPSPSLAPDKTVLFTEFLTYDSRTYKRRKGTSSVWTLVESAVPVSNIESRDLLSSRWFTLHLARFNQYPEEPLHWALVIAPTGEETISGPSIPDSEELDLNATYVLEVRGEPEQMFFVERKLTGKPVSLLEDLHSSYELAALGHREAQSVIKEARHTEPPKANSRKEVRENCQGWCGRAVEKLAKMGLVKGGDEKVRMLRDMMEDVKVL